MRHLCMRSVIAVCCWCVLGAPLLAQQPTGKKVAVLIGVDKYDKRGFRDLEFAERDVEELAKVLKPAGYEIHLLTGSAVGDKRATLQNIGRVIKQVLNGRTKHDLILVALAGHGLQIEVRGSDGRVQTDSFFCPYDTQKSDTTTMLSMGRLFADIEDRGGGTNLVLVDACREDPTRSRGMDGSTVKTLPEGMAVLFGCAAGQKTYETQKAGGGHGVFFHAVLEGLRGGAKKNDAGDVTWNGLVEYVTDRVDSDVERFIDAPRATQTPNEVKNLRGRSPVLLTVKVSNKAPERAPALEKVAGTRAGQEWDGNGLKMKFCWCPSGKFMMGSPKHESNRRLDEDQVAVTISRGFWLGKYEVTQAEYERLMGNNPSYFSSDGGGKDKVVGMNTSDFPVEEVSWDEAMAFCAKLTEQEQGARRLPADWNFTLPTEAQWEYACRAGTKTAVAFGDKLSSRLANFDGFNFFGYNTSDRGPFLERTTKVQSYRANAWGLYQMHGNVCEWCRDWYQKNLPGGTDPEVRQESRNRVLRGGGWFRAGWYCRSADRSRSAPDFGPVGNGDFGFRVAVVQSIR